MPNSINGVDVLGDYLKPELSDELLQISTLGLAHVGDAVYELMVRTLLCMQGASSAKQLHNGAVEFVSAKAQASAADNMLPILNEKERDMFRRGRNARVSSVPRTSTNEEYHTATGIEALFGYLYLRGETKRLEELFEIIVRNSLFGKR